MCLSGSGVLDSLKHHDVSSNYLCIKFLAVKKLYVLLLLLPFAVRAQIPAGYYNSILGLNGTALQTALYNKIKNHTQLSYTPGLWDAYASTDKKPGTNKLWTIYSDKPGQASPYEFTLGTQQCSGSSPNAEAGCYNREHIWPRSYFGGAVPPMNTDLWIVYPTDYWVNSKRGDLPYGKVTGTATFTSQNGSRIGANSYMGAPSGQCFEPIDSFKGDIARSYFYVATRYLGEDAGWSDWAMANKAALKPWAVQMLLEWHHLDPVSNKEIRRNDSAYALQNNRNPFIDYPQFADCIWGVGSCSTLSVVDFASSLNSISISPNPATDRIEIDWQALSPNEVLAVDVLNVQGQVLFHQNEERSTRQIIRVSEWSKGMYFIRIYTKSGVRNERVIVQ